MNLIAASLTFWHTILIMRWFPSLNYVKESIWFMQKPQWN